MCRFTVEERLFCAESSAAGNVHQATRHPVQHQQKYADIMSLTNNAPSVPGCSLGPEQGVNPAAAESGPDHVDLVDVQQSQSPDVQQQTEEPAAGATYTCISGAQLPFGAAEVQRLLRPYNPPGSADDYVNDEIVNISMDMFMRENHTACSHGAGASRCYVINSLFYTKLMSW